MNTAKIDNPDLRFFSDYIERELGIIYDSSNSFQLENRLKEIAKNMQVATVSDLRTQAEKSGLSGPFKQMLLDIATNNESLFFRDKRVFTSLEQMLLPELFSQPNRLRFRFWSAACSTGQEPYSLAMILKGLRDKHGSIPSCEIMASDISDRALQRAKQGRFSHLEVQRGLPATHLVKYFEKGDDEYWTIKPELRNMIHFFTENLLKLTSVSGPFDLILCRNVLIYQNHERKQVILDRLTDMLGKGGYLILGAAESLVGIETKLKRELIGDSYFYKKD